jgi:hypothetical protein
MDSLELCTLVGSAFVAISARHLAASLRSVTTLIAGRSNSFSLKALSLTSIRSSKKRVQQSPCEGKRLSVIPKAHKGLKSL